MELTDFSREELERYGRHFSLPQFGTAAQRRLRAARVLLIGAGGLGSPAAQYLVAAGVGALGIVDPDKIDRSNLHRQVLYTSDELGRPKVAIAARRLTAMNPNVKIEPHPIRLVAANALDLFAKYDVILDGTDNFATRYLINDAALLAGKPLVWGSVFRFEGQVTVFPAGGGPCYRCLHPTPPPASSVPDCAVGGVLGILPGLVGTWQATEAIKLITGVGEPLVGRMLLINTLGNGFRLLRLPADPDCAACGRNATLRELTDMQDPCNQPDATQTVPTINVEELRHRLEHDPELTIIDVREPHETALGIIPGARLIPKGQLEEHLPAVPQDEPLVLYCKSGRRSAEATRTLLDKGFGKATSLEGGYEAWQASQAGAGG